ncbi:hypothetical protein [Turneriella parva]|uniref:Uncharacterized protein n=1 Tax=Turneriella parva (strain ATCC BAA-1111 / DSM 21527 / NCTC 11395 / H) TaxID=869212 RepID=I4B4I8_TURPD|nr:hypothetical protein [Turneriella parva]AFM12195.1 hypothetical protein Turpa_1547 [Turneriella parva DSM 21527]
MRILLLFFCGTVLAQNLFAAEPPAQTKPVDQHMLRAMREYFHEEKSAAKMAIFGAALAGGAGAYLTSQSDLGRGAGYALIGLAPVALIVGGTVYFRTNSQLRRLEDQLETAPRDYRREENIRMQKVNRQFQILRIAEYSLFGFGALATTIGAARGADLTTGVGIGIMVDAALMLLFDHFAEVRAQIYTERLAEFGAAARTLDIIQGFRLSYAF